MRRERARRANPWGAPRPLTPGDPDRVGPWELLARLGGGGMGTVYLARRAEGADGATHEAGAGPAVVALKVAHPSLAGPVSRDRLRAEAHALRIAGHLDGGRGAPPCATLVAVDTEGPVPWIATAYLPAPTLRQLVDQHGGWPAPAVRRIGHALSTGLAGLHGAGVLHRDVKPSNILVTPEGPRLIDFGIAREAGAEPRTAAGEVVGSPGYLAPERAAGEPATAAGDVFGAAAALAFTATGRPPFGQGTPAELTFRMVHAGPDLAGLDEPLRAVLARALAPEPTHRPTADQFAAELTDHHDTPADGGATPPGGWLAALPPVVSAALTDRPIPEWGTAEPLRESSAAGAPPPDGDRAPGRRAVLLAAGSAALLVGAAGAGSYLLGRSVRNAEERAAEPPAESPADPPAGASGENGPETGAEWHYEGPISSLGRPALGDGVLVLPPDPDRPMIALDTADGEERWSVRYAGGRRLVATPDGRTVLVGYVPESDAYRLAMVDAETGETWASTPLGMRVGEMSETPVVAVRDRVAFLAGFRVDERVAWQETADAPRGLVAYDIDGDELLWERDIPPVPGIMVVGVVSDDLLIVLGRDILTAYRVEDGTEVWERELGAALVTDDLVTEVPERRMTVDGEGGVVITGRGVLYLDAATGETHWSVEPDTVPGLTEDAAEAGITTLFGEPAVRDGVVYLAGSRFLVQAVELRGKDLVWDWESESGLAPLPAGAVVAGNHVFPPLADGTTALIALDVTTGEVAWQLEEPDFSVDEAQVLSDDTRLYVRRGDTVRSLPLDGGDAAVKRE